LEKAGFGDYSATHLEYSEAIRANIKTIVFVRDHLEAEYSQYAKTKKIDKLIWLKEEKDARLFEIIGPHKKLANTKRNNWYWTFRNSIDLKQRLKIDLKGEIAEIRLNQLINSCIIKTDSYQKVIDGNLDKSILNYSLKPFKSIMSGKQDESVSFSILLEPAETKKKKHTYIVELFYRTIYGDSVRMELVLNASGELLIIRI
jgi:hypothetical protein